MRRLKTVRWRGSSTRSTTPVATRKRIRSPPRSTGAAGWPARAHCSGSVATAHTRSSGARATTRTSTWPVIGGGQRLDDLLVSAQVDPRPRVDPAPHLLVRERGVGPRLEVLHPPQPRPAL